MLLNNAFGMAFAQSIMELAEDPTPATAASQASGPKFPAVATTRRDSRDTRDVATAESPETSRYAAGNPAPDGSNRVSFSVPAADLGIDDAGRTCNLPEATGVVATSTPGVVRDPAVNTKVQTAAASTYYENVLLYVNQQQHRAGITEPTRTLAFSAAGATTSS